MVELLRVSWLKVWQPDMNAVFNPSLGDIKGKVGGIVFQGGRGPAIIRSKGLNVNKLTPAQALRRESLTGIMKEWAYGLSQSQRDGWAALAESYPAPGPFGNDQVLAGNALFAKINTVRVMNGSAVLSAPPADLEVGALATLSLDLAEEGSDEIQVSWTPVTAAAERIMCYVIANHPVGRSYARSDYVYAMVDAAGGSVGEDFWIGPRWGLMVAGMKVSILCKVYNVDNGATSSGLLASKVVTVAP